ncbi:hypothetical protein [Candidatus Leptofilum sp.]|uniref:hypothetical protein n=1 Tax=Candidatus Leptofilum sp. TaxID=3241576 RepID=UPI003B592F91
MTSQQKIDEIETILDRVLADLPQEPLPERVVGRVMLQFPNRSSVSKPFRLWWSEGVLALLVAVMLGLLWLVIRQGLIPSADLTLASKWLSLGLALALVELGLMSAIHYMFFGRRLYRS